MPKDLNIKLYMLLLSKLGDFFSATFEALVAGRVRILKSRGTSPKPASLARALGSGGLGGKQGGGEYRVIFREISLRNFWSSKERCQ